MPGQSLQLQWAHVVQSANGSRKNRVLEELVVQQGHEGGEGVVAMDGELVLGFGGIVVFAVRSVEGGQRTGSTRPTMVRLTTNFDGEECLLRLPRAVDAAAEGSLGEQPNVPRRGRDEAGHSRRSRGDFDQDQPEGGRLQVQVQAEGDGCISGYAEGWLGRR